jgi:2,3-dihydroxybenzoate decarboxylase
MKKIALEEHFITDELLKYTQESDFVSMNPQKVKDFQERLLDFDQLRIAAMDQAEIDISVLSLTDPGLQGELDTDTAVTLSKKTNLFLAEKIVYNSTRFRGFAALALQDPISAAKELENCVRNYQFVGALINGQTQGYYLDDVRFYPFWEKVEELDVPIYLHPGSPAKLPESYQGQEELAGPLWGWTAETATHALRFIFSGLFDRFPTIKLILGHMGEALPYMLWRLDSRWEIMKHKKELNLAPSQYFKKNIFITTSGMCSNGPLLCAIHEMGMERVMFSVDYPYESSEIAAQFIEKAPLDDLVKESICYQNAKRILKI